MSNLLTQILVSVAKFEGQILLGAWGFLAALVCWALYAVQWNIVKNFFGVGRLGRCFAASVLAFVAHAAMVWPLILSIDFGSGKHIPLSYVAQTATVYTLYFAALPSLVVIGVLSYFGGQGWHRSLQAFALALVSAIALNIAMFEGVVLGR